MSRGGLVVLGEVLKPHGVRGEVRVASYADSPSLFKSLSGLWLRLGGQEPLWRKLSGVREVKDALLVKFEGLDSREAAEGLRGFEVCVKADELPELESGQVYQHELIGLEVYCAGEDGLRKLGEISGLLDVPGQEIWVIAADNGSEILFPAVPDFVREFDIPGSRVVVEPPEGLLELYTGG